MPRAASAGGADDLAKALPVVALPVVVMTVAGDEPLPVVAASPTRALNVVRKRHAHHGRKGQRPQQSALLLPKGPRNALRSASGPSRHGPATTNPRLTPPHQHLAKRLGPQVRNLIANLVNNAKRESPENREKRENNANRGRSACRKKHHNQPNHAQTIPNTASPSVASNGRAAKSAKNVPTAGPILRRSLTSASRARISRAAPSQSHTSSNRAAGLALPTVCQPSCANRHVHRRRRAGGNPRHSGALRFGNRLF